MRSQRKRRRTKKLSMPEIMLTPLIDTALTLLVIFIITAPIAQSSIKVNLPYGKSQETQDGGQEIVITLSSENKLFFNDSPLNQEQLVESVVKAIGEKDDLPVYVRADESISYGKVVELVDSLKEAGVKLVAMSTRAIK